jgi:hypothetical protein
MSRLWGSLGIAAILLVAGSAQGQENLFRNPQVYDPSATGVEYLIEPTNTLLRGSDAQGSPLPGSGNVGGVRGLVGGQAVGSGSGNVANVSVGFTYLVPLWSFRDFQLAAPRGYETAFPILGFTGHVDSKFAYVPRIDIDYYIEDLDFGIGTSGTFLNLSGRVDRQAGSPLLGIAQLNANSNLTIISANIVEFSRRYGFFDLFPKKTPRSQAVSEADTILELRIGSRYVSVDQNYNGTLLGGSTGQNITTRFSTQTFRGFGITGASIWTIPCGKSLEPFFTARQSLLLGENRRNSSVTAIAQGFPPLVDTLYDNKTSLVPITELELGFDLAIANVIRIRNANEEQPRFNVRVAAVAQYWGGLGPLSAATNQGFRQSDLFLVGGYIQAGFRY